MAEFISLHSGTLNKLRDIDPRMMSFNVEMTEVTGGTFWKAYTPAQISGEEPFPPVSDFTQLANLMQVYPPINLYDQKLRSLTKNLGTAWVRVSGTWATKTYYDFDGSTNGTPPDGYQSILTKDQWIGVLDFVKAVDARLMISVANCSGLHQASEPWHPAQAEQIFALSKEYGVPIDAAEFMNEPNMLTLSGAPDGYSAADYARDQDLFFSWVRQNYPETLLVGPCNTEGAGMGDIAQHLGPCASLDDLMQGTAEKPDVYSYHYYNGISERLASVMPDAHWNPEQATTESYLSAAGQSARFNVPGRDKYCPGGQMWVTESGDAGGGGDTWASTYLDVFRTLNELGEFSTITDGIIFHNTLASSDYGFLAPETFDPRPNYFAVLLWNRLMGTEVYDSCEPLREGVHLYAHSRRDGQPGVAYLLINNSLTESTSVELPSPAQRYTLSAETLRSRTMLLNGHPLKPGKEYSLSDLMGEQTDAGLLELPPATCTFLIL